MEIKNKIEIYDVLKFQISTMLYFPGNVFLFGVPFFLSILLFHGVDPKGKYAFFVWVILILLTYFVMLIGFVLFLIMAQLLFIFINYSRSNAKLVYSEHTLFFEEDKLIDTSKTTRVDYNWNAFLKYKESKNYFLIYPTKISALIIPKRNISKDEIDSIRHILHNKLGANKKPKISHPK